MKKLSIATAAITLMMMAGTAMFAGEHATSADQAQQPALDSNAGAAAAKPRSKRDTAAVIGSAAAIGSAIGAMIAKDDRAKGAAIGAAVGGIVGLIYDRINRSGRQHEATVLEAPQTSPETPEKKIL